MCTVSLQYAGTYLNDTSVYGSMYNRVEYSPTHLPTGRLHICSIFHEPYGAARLESDLVCPAKILRTLVLSMASRIKIPERIVHRLPYKHHQAGAIPMSFNTAYLVLCILQCVCGSSRKYEIFCNVIMHCEI